jgi:hypothetical protein
MADCVDSGYRALSGPQTRSITLAMRSKRPKVRAPRAIAPFSGTGGIVSDPYSVKMSSSDHRKKAMARRIGRLNRAFRPRVVSTRLTLRRATEIWLTEWLQGDKPNNRVTGGRANVGQVRTWGYRGCRGAGPWPRLAIRGSGHAQTAIGSPPLLRRFCPGESSPGSGQGCAPG